MDSPASSTGECFVDPNHPRDNDHYRIEILPGVATTKSASSSEHGVRY